MQHHADDGGASPAKTEAASFHDPQVQPFSFHKIDPPSNKVETSLTELRSMYHFMYRMRRMEIAADMMYKAKLIRGFCHL